jgi:hypothetical protein
VTISFGEGVKSATSAAGDLIPARVRHTEPRPRKRLLPAEGAPAGCRIMRLENDILADRLNVTVACEAVELNGRWIPFSAVRDGPAQLLDSTRQKLPNGRIVVRGRREPGSGATFVFPTGGAPIEVGPFSSEWITTVQPAAATRNP